MQLDAKSSWRRVAAPGLVVAVLATIAAPVPAHSGIKHSATSAGDPHAAHRSQTMRHGYSIREADYQPPAVELTDADGRAVRVDTLLNGDHPVVMQFIFTTCTTICPIMGATFSQAQADLVSADPRTHLISVSIDPEHDTPAKLKAYATRFAAGRNWQFLSGDAADIHRLMRAFDVLYAGDNKMYHQFNTFILVPGQASWIRVEGMPGAGELVAEYRSLIRRD